MNRRSLLANRETELYSVIKDMINESNYVNLCVITKVHNEDFCDVSLYYAGMSGAEVVITDVRILHPGTARCKVTIEPDVGDYVLLLTPKDFVEELEFNREAEPSKEMYEPYANCNACCILIKSDSEEDGEVKASLNVDLEGNVTFDTYGTVSAVVGKTDDDDEEPLASLTVGPDGDVAFDTNGRLSATIGTDDDDIVLEVSSEDGVSLKDYNDNSVLINADGITVEDTNGNKAVLSSDGVAVSTGGEVSVEATQTGLITLKNSIDSLGNIIATLIDHVKTFSQNVQSIDTVGSPASHSAGPGIIANMVALQTQLDQLKQTAGQVLG